MLKDITLGQYFPGNTIVHRLDPRTKLLLTILFIVTLFVANEAPVSYLVLLLALGGMIALSRIPPRTMLRGLKPLVIIIAFTAVLNIFYTPGTPIFTLGFLHPTWEGLAHAAFMMLRILMLVCGTFLLTYTTSPIALTDGLEQLLSPLKKVRFPVHELSMIMSIALRFIPTLVEETDKIMSAQKARGANFETGSLIRRAKAMVPLLVPLFVSAFRRADELAIAMECRCYHGGEGRTRLKQLRMAGRDAGAFLAGAALLAGLIVLRRLGL
jgi:energy-coupling factor transport system permease protein